MCNLDLVSGLLIAAKLAFLVALGALTAAMVNASSLFTAAANIPLMVTAIIASAASTGFYTGALIELNRCTASPCGAQLDDMRKIVTQLLISLAAFAAGLIALTAVVAIPFAGRVAVGLFLSGFVGLVGLVTGGAEIVMAVRTIAFHDCLARAGSGRNISIFVAIIAGVAAAAAIVWAGYFSVVGKIPIFKIRV